MLCADNDMTVCRSEQRLLRASVALLVDASARARRYTPLSPPPCDDGDNAPESGPAIPPNEPTLFARIALDSPSASRWPAFYRSCH
ncbi:hypothetical protein V5799_029822 [Amblyomma americanum]|uniref:Uncharacterized protein n=1 Tax=Amblyomma americanum TaxID=6943 RepID=A0AAQ4EPX7_AMBAM